MNRSVRAEIAHETLSIMEDGSYRAPDGAAVSIAAPLADACAGTTLYRPGDLPALIEQLPAVPRHDRTQISVSDRTTLAAGHALTQIGGHVACLNFASAKHAGGGFLTGAQAQEESLARASGLYATLQTQPDYYTGHGGTTLYSDHTIFSPQVPVFRDDADELVQHMWTTSFITCAAVNAGALRNNQPDKVAQIRSTMEQRTRMVLAVAAVNRVDTLVLGAWGCGVFQNDPVAIAAIFAEALAQSEFAGLFRHVEFAVFDRTSDRKVFAAFDRQFS